MLSFVYQDMINLIVFFHREKSKCIYGCCNVENCTLEN